MIFVVIKSIIHDFILFRERDDRYSRRDPYYNPPYSPKRRKLESGEAETVEFDPPRRAPYSPYDAPGMLFIWI